MRKSVLDASAILAALFREPGADDRRGRVGRRGSHADPLPFKLLAQDVQQIAGTQHFQGLRTVRTYLRHQTQTAANDLFRKNLGLSTFGG